jgi:hypothetical protein
VILVSEIGLEVDEETLKQTKASVEKKGVTQIDSLLTSLILGQVESEAGKKTVIRALIAFTWGQRLYFIVRSAMMGILGAVITGLIVIFFGEVNAIQVALVSVFSYIATLAVTRLLDVRITRGSKSIVASLSRHRRLRSAILDHF